VGPRAPPSSRCAACDLLRSYVGKFVSGWQECLDALEKIFPQVPLLPPVLSPPSPLPHSVLVPRGARAAAALALLPGASAPLDTRRDAPPRAEPTPTLRVQAGSADRAAADEMLARAAAIAERLPPAAPTPRDRAGVLAAARGADALLAERGGDFALGGAFSLVDAALLPGLPLLEAEARLLDPAAAPLREAADELPAVARWLAAVDARVSSVQVRRTPLRAVLRAVRFGLQHDTAACERRARVQARVGSDALSQALRVSSAAGAESPEVSQAATRAIAALVSELDWREELSAEVRHPAPCALRLAPCALHRKVVLRVQLLAPAPVLAARERSLCARRRTGPSNLDQLCTTLSVCRQEPEARGRRVPRASARRRRRQHRRPGP
jgi:hypothetical protein